MEIPETLWQRFAQEQLLREAIASTRLDNDPECQTISLEDLHALDEKR